VTLCRVPEALALTSLYLRSQGEFILWRVADGTGGPKANEWLFYQIGAVALLPDGAGQGQRPRHSNQGPLSRWAT
jgi:hypothetical protein